MASIDYQPSNKNSSFMVFSNRTTLIAEGKKIPHSFFCLNKMDFEQRCPVNIKINIEDQIYTRQRVSIFKHLCNTSLKNNSLQLYVTHIELTQAILYSHTLQSLCACMLILSGTGAYSLYFLCSSSQISVIYSTQKNGWY